MAKHKWKAGSRVPVSVDANMAAPILAGLQADDGTILPDDVVEAAKPKESPLHQCFTWDDQIAATFWRRHEARIIIRALVVVPENGASEVSAYTHVKASKDGSGGYYPTAAVLINEDLYTRALQEAMEGLAMAKHRLQELNLRAPRKASKPARRAAKLVEEAEQEIASI